jgi:hypothetical protein
LPRFRGLLQKVTSVGASAVTSRHGPPASSSLVSIASCTTVEAGTLEDAEGVVDRTGSLAVETLPPER